MRFPARRAFLVLGIVVLALVLFFWNSFPRPSADPVQSPASSIPSHRPEPSEPIQPSVALGPPEEVALVAFKEEKRLALWVRGGAAPRASGRRPAWTFVRDYPILAASGRAGPKLREGDRQVPEGVYRVVSMNPYSKFYLSMMIDYPNAFDRRKGSEDGRTRLGGEICIHGGAASIGCLAVGDEAIEELYHLVGEVEAENVLVLIAPNDIRQGRPVVRSPQSPPWVDELYRDLRRELAAFEPRPDPATD